MHPYRRHRVRVPGSRLRVGLFEAGVNILVLVAGVFVPYYAFVVEITAGDITTEPPSTMDTMVNFILASAICVIVLKARDRRSTGTISQGGFSF